MSSSEIAFLALGLVLGAAIGAAFVEAVRSRPAPRREVRITIAPNSVNPRRPGTLALAGASAIDRPIPGSPEDEAWPELVPAAAAAALPLPSGPGLLAAGARTHVPSGGVSLPASAVAVPVNRRPPLIPRSDGGLTPGLGTRADGASASLGRPTAVGVLDPVAPLTELERRAPLAPAALPAIVDVGVPAPERLARPRPPAEPVRPFLAPSAVAVTRPAGSPGGNGVGHGNGNPARNGVGHTNGASAGNGIAAGDGADRPMASARRSDGGPSGSGDAAGTGPASPSSPASADACEPLRHLVDERCAVAAGAAEQARKAADALRDAQRAYDALRDRVEQAQANADPRGLAAAKDALHKAFRVASGASVNAEETEAAAREWLTRINELNARAREAARIVETGNAELRAALPRLERMSVDADAARIGAEGAEVACREARVHLAECEEAQEAGRQAAAKAPPEEPAPYERAWPSQPIEPFDATVPPPPQALPVVVRVLRGDRGARERLVAALAGGDAEAHRAWQLRVAQLADAVSARAIEAGYLDLPEDDPFWGLFTHREAREIVGALSALGFRYDGMGGFADGRVPAPRDLSLAVGYAGLDRMRIRVWPQEAELAALYARALVAADEWLASMAGDLTLGEMVDALGARAADLADVWNAWGRMRPQLLELD